MHRIKTTIMIILSFSILMGQSILSDSSGWTDDGKFIMTSADNQFKLRFDIRMYIDGAYFLDDTEDVLSNGTHLRKARFAAKTQLWGKWNAEWDMDIAEYSVEIKDMWLSYNGWKNAMLKMGHFKVPFGLEILTSSRIIAFPERAYNALAFKLGRRTSIGYTKWGNKWHASGALFAQGMDDDKNQKTDETGNGFAGRFAIAPIKTPGLLIHLGGAFAIHKPIDDKGHISNEINHGAVDFTAEPETKIGDIEMLDTDNIFHVEKTTQTGLEGAIRLNSLSLQGEFMQAELTRETGYTDATFMGGYGFISWFITGESRPWQSEDGEFGMVLPKNKKIGSFELLARFSHLNLSDEDAMIYGGKANNITLGVNWYVNPNLRFYLNYAMVDNSENATGDSAPSNYDFSYVQFRTLVFF